MEILVANKKWKPATRSSAYKTSEKGSLFLEFNHSRVVALRACPFRAWSKGQHRATWQGTRFVDLSIRRLASAAWPELLHEGQEPCRYFSQKQPFFVRLRVNFRVFLEELPLEAVQVFVNLPLCTRDWAVLQLLVESKDALRLARRGDVNLVIAFAMAEEVLEKRPTKPLAFSRRWLRKKSSKALSRLGFPRRPLSLKVLRKVPVAELRPTLLKRLAKVLNEEPFCKILSHAKQVTSLMLAMMSSDVRFKSSFAFPSQARAHPETKVCACIL